MFSLLCRPVFSTSGVMRFFLALLLLTFCQFRISFAYVLLVPFVVAIFVVRPCRVCDCSLQSRKL